MKRKLVIREWNLCCLNAIANKVIINKQNTPMVIVIDTDVPLIW